MKRTGRHRNGTHAKRRRARIARRLALADVKFRRVRLYRIWLEELERRFAAAYAPRHGTQSLADAIQRRLNEPPDSFRADYGISLLEMPKVGDEWDTYPAPGVKVHYTMLKDGIAEATVTLPPIAHQIDVEIGFTNPEDVAK